MPCPGQIGNLLQEPPRPPPRPLQSPQLSAHLPYGRLPLPTFSALSAAVRSGWLFEGGWESNQGLRVARHVHKGETGVPLLSCRLPSPRPPSQTPPDLLQSPKPSPKLSHTPSQTSSRPPTPPASPLLHPFPRAGFGSRYETS